MRRQYPTGASLVYGAFAFVGFAIGLAIALLARDPHWLGWALLGSILASTVLGAWLWVRGA